MSLDFDFYSSLESLKQKKADRTISAKKNCTDAIQRKFAHFQFSLNTSLVSENFSILQFFADYQSRAQELYKSVSNVIDLYHNQEIKGGGLWDTTQTILGKLDVSLNRVNFL